MSSDHVCSFWTDSHRVCLIHVRCIVLVFRWLENKFAVLICIIGLIYSTAEPRRHWLNVLEAIRYRTWGLIYPHRVSTSYFCWILQIKFLAQFLIFHSCHCSCMDWYCLQTVARTCTGMHMYGYAPFQRLYSVIGFMLQRYLLRMAFGFRYRGTDKE